MSLNGTVWAPIGPTPIAVKTTRDNGLVGSIAINPYNQNVVSIGTAGGGVWRSRDRGATWTPLFDRQLALGIGEPAAIAIDPNDTQTIYVGSNQGLVFDNTGLFGPVDTSQGLFKSTDSGNSWIQLGSGFPAGNNGNALTTFRGRKINVVIVDPTDSNRLWCAASDGIFHSADGGHNWTLGINSTGDARSLALDPTSPANARML